MINSGLENAVHLLRESLGTLDQRVTNVVSELNEEIDHVSTQYSGLEETDVVLDEKISVLHEKISVLQKRVSWMGYTLLAQTFVILSLVIKVFL